MRVRKLWHGYLTVVVLAAAIASPALAAPDLSGGTYAVTQTILCQISAKVDSTTGQITIFSGGTGLQSMGALTIAFSGGSGGTYALNGYVVTDSPIFESFTNGSHRGSRPKTSQLSDNAQWTNSDTQLSLLGIDGGIYDVVYGPLQNGDSGPPVSFIGVLEVQSGGKCISNIVGHLQ